MYDEPGHAKIEWAVWYPAANMVKALVFIECSYQTGRPAIVACGHYLAG